MRRIPMFRLRVGGGRVMEVKVFNWVDEGFVEGG